MESAGKGASKWLSEQVFFLQTREDCLGMERTIGVTSRDVLGTERDLSGETSVIREVNELIKVFDSLKEFGGDHVLRRRANVAEKKNGTSDWE